MKKIILFILPALALASCSKDELHKDMYQLPEVFYTGTSTSFVSYLEDNGTVTYKESGAVKDPYLSVRDNGGNMIRLILEPEALPRNAVMDAEGAPDIDWQTWTRVKKDLQRAKDAGLEVVMTLKLEKTVPKVWQHITDQEQLGQTLYDWCYEMLDEMGKIKMPKIVAIGNEINAAFMSPESDYNNNVYNYERNVFFVNKGIKAVRDIARKYNTEIKTAVHIFSPGNLTWWLSEHYERGLTDFDVMALSYYYGYPGHSMGSWRSFTHLGQYLRGALGKDFMIMETSFPWTILNGDAQANNYGVTENGYEATPADQRRWLANLANDVRQAGGLGVISWGNESLPTTTWIYPDTGYGKGSTWENNSYWDFDGNLHEGIKWMGDVK